MHSNTTYNRLFSSRNLIYFPGLNSLRFIGALTVILQHVELLKRKLHYHTSIAHPAATKVGEYGVTLFFVLSGFLITYLLLVEKQTYGVIAIKKFYVRRILRIWPLYYLLLAVAILVLPNMEMFSFTEKPYDRFYQNVGAVAPWYIFMLANVAFVTGNTIAYCPHLWSVACEEHFYLVWPHVIKNTDKYLTVFLILIVSNLLLIQAASYALFRYESQLPGDVARMLVFICKFFYFFRVNAMVIGGLGAAIFYYKKQTMLSIIYSEIAQVAALVCIIFLLLYRGKLPYTIHTHTVLSILFSVLIINIATNEKALFKLENRVLNYLGKISYGLYMYNLIAIALAYNIIICFCDKPADSQLANYLLYTFTILITIVLSHLSYYFIETFFLRLKKYAPEASSSSSIAK